MKTTPIQISFTKTARKILKDFRFGKLTPLHYHWRTSERLIDALAIPGRQMIYVSLDQRVVSLLNRAVATGLYGGNLYEACERLICDGLRKELGITMSETLRPKRKPLTKRAPSR